MRTDRELLIECVKQLKHIDEIYDFEPLATTISMIREINQALNTPVVSGRALLDKAKQMRLEQQNLVDTYAERYNSTEIGILQGIDRIVKLIERHYA
jgi:hypothetical protein